MQWPEPCTFTVDLEAGRMTGAVHRYRKRLCDLQGLYADEAAFAALLPQQGQAVVYEVTDHRPSGAPGDLITGITRMAPGKVGDEYYMTRGHLHAVADRPELYFGLRGHGLMVMESADGQTRTVEMAPQVVCYVPPLWIHRSVNTGAQDLVMLFCYPADAGQDYGIIERSNGLRTRIVDDGQGGWRAQANPGYCGRSPAQVLMLQGLLRRSARVQP